MQNAEKDAHLACKCKRARQAALAPRACRFYAGEMLMGLLALSAALAALASATRWSFAVFLALQGARARGGTLPPFDQ